MEESGSFWKLAATPRGFAYGPEDEQAPLERICSEVTDNMLADADDAADLVHGSERGR
jgi:hypothetical protein